MQCSLSLPGDSGTEVYFTDEEGGCIHLTGAYSMQILTTISFHDTFY